MALRSIELMIGDWVKSRGEIEQVTSVYDGFICTDSFEDSHDYYFDPIPLTAEILEKNGFRHGDGFEKRWYDVKVEDKKVSLYQSNTFYTLKIDEGIWPKLNNIYIHFVHELQHALRLCGIEKEITI